MTKKIKHSLPLFLCLLIVLLIGTSQIAFAKTGLVKKNGKWVYVVNDKITAKTGITKRADGKGGWFFVEKGKLCTNKAGITKRVDGKAGWFYVEKGKLCTNKAGITKRLDGKAGWFYVEKGVLQTKKSGLTKRIDGKGGWYYVKKGKLDTTKTGWVKRIDGKGGQFYVKNGVYQAKSTKRKVTDVTINIADSTIFTGQTIQAKAQITPSNATNKKVIWKSSNKSIATVDSTGKIKGIKQGIVTITATATDGSEEYDWCTVYVLTDKNAPYRKGLAAAKKKGPAAVIQYCEQNRKNIYIGRYGNRGVGFYGVDSTALNAEADYSAALEALYKPWRNQIFARSLAAKTRDPYEQAYLVCMYISGMYFGHMVYAPRTVGFGLCPAVAPFLSEGMLTNLPGSGCAVEKSYLGGNCTATANLLLDILRDHGFDCQLQNNMPGTYHVGVRVKFTSGSHKGESFIFDPMFSGVYEVNLQVHNDDSIYARFEQLLANYGPINYNP